MMFKERIFHPLHSIKANEPWDHVQIDLIGPLPESNNKYTQILTLVDMMSEYTVLKTLLTKKMEKMAEVLWSIFMNFGVSKIIQSDNGPEFVNKLVQQLMELYGIDRKMIIIYNPQIAGLVERKNKEVRWLLQKCMKSATD